MAHKVCPQCSTAAPVDAVFCAACGRQFRSQFVPPPSVEHPPEYAASQPVSPRGMWLAIVGMAAVVAVLVIMLNARQHSTVSRTEHNSPLDSSVAAQSRGGEQGLGSRHSGTDNASQDAGKPAGDLLEDAARREIDKASMRIPGAATPEVSPSDGRVHLRGGGSISKEQYEETARKVQSSRIIPEGMPPPPVN